MKIDHIGHHMPQPWNGRYATTGDNQPQAHYRSFDGTLLRNSLLRYVAATGIWFNEVTR